MKSRALLIALAAHAAVLVLAMPASPWEYDEPLFFEALHRYDPLAHHPPPPGYPVFIHFAQLVRLLIPSDFATLVAISLAASAIGFVLLALAFRNITGDETTGIIGALLFYFSPAMLIHSTLPISDPGGLALLAAALYFGSGHPVTRLPGRPAEAEHRETGKPGNRAALFGSGNPVTRLPGRPAEAEHRETGKPGNRAALLGSGNPVTRLPGRPAEAEHRETGQPGNRAALLFALFSALAIGWRIQLAIFVVPFFLVSVALLRTWRARLIALATFTIVCLIWLTPLTIAVGGVRELIDFETGQGKYLAAHDAAESRTGWTPARIAFRFIGRAWGTELMALAVLACAAIGFFAIWRADVSSARRTGRPPSFLPLAAGAAVYIGVALWVMDPADGVRYSLPFVLATALVAAAGVTLIARRFAYAVAALAAIVFLIYAGPLLWQRRTTDSPPYRAATYARSAFPSNAVALYELPLAPHAHYFLRDYDPHRVDDGLAKFWNRPDVPLFLYTDGATSQPDARVFRWNDSDAYRKLTRNHYRVSSVVPLPPERRFRIISGIYGQEREQDGLEWRWLDSVAELQLPDGPPRRLTLVLGLAPAAPLESNSVIVSVAAEASALVKVTRGKRSEVTVGVPAGAPIVELLSERSFIPAEVRSMRSGDRRRLAVELYELRTTTSAARAAQPPAQ